MHFILTVYSKSVYREYLLPHQREGAWEVLLPGSEFDQAEDIPLCVAYQDGQPEFLPSGLFTLRPARGKRHFPLPLEAGNVYFLSPNSGERLVLTLRETERFAPAYQIYTLDPETPVMIGASAENSIVYDAGHTVSGVHAVISTKGGCSSLEDKGCNGVYINHKRVEGSAVLQSGDQIYVLGLLIVYFENCIALDPSCPGLRIQGGLTPLKGGTANDRLAAALQIHNSEIAGEVEDAQEDGTVLLSDALSEEEEATVYQPLPFAEEEATVYQPLPFAEEEETVYQPLPDGEDETVLETSGQTGYERRTE